MILLLCSLETRTNLDSNSAEVLVVLLSKTVRSSDFIARISSRTCWSKGGAGSTGDDAPGMEDRVTGFVIASNSKLFSNFQGNNFVREAKGATKCQC